MPPLSLKLGYTSGWTASYQVDRVESPAWRETWLSISALCKLCSSEGWGYPEVPKGLPWGELEAGGGSGLPSDSMGQHPSGFTY